MHHTTIAALRAAPGFRDRQATIDRVGLLAEEAARNDARPVGFRLDEHRD